MSLRRKSSSDMGGGCNRSGAPPTPLATDNDKTKVDLVNLITGKEGLVADDTSFNGLKDQEDTLVLLVDGVRFLMYRSLLLAHPETMLGRMFDENNSRLVRPNEKGEYRIENVSWDIFKIILGFYRIRELAVPYDANMNDIKEACDYFLIPFNIQTIVSENLSSLMHELSNDGAKKKFECFLQSDIVPKMAETAMKGERECHIVCLKDEDVVDWDEEYPPSVGEDQLTIIKSSEINRFLKYIENRGIAKAVLQEKGLKKIRIGIEGFPTHKEKVKVKQHGKIQVTYFYVQRPFIVMSWEKEELRSRHVDFANVSTFQLVQTDANNTDQVEVNTPPINLNAVDEIEQIRQQSQ